VFQAPTRHWFQSVFGAPTSAQSLGWPALSAGHSTLLLAPTGSGKTLAAFLVALDRLLFGTPAHEGGRCRVLYVSPLKALGVDVEKNLQVPLLGIRQAAEALGVPYQPVVVGVRSGDTPAKDRARLARNPPDILITTPESLYLLLTSQAAQHLAQVETVIIDEIHALVPTKRGAHLALSLERLEALRGGDRPPLQRIGLSATQRPLSEVAAFLGGGVWRAGAFVPRPVEIVDAGQRRALTLSVEVPFEDPAEESTEAPAPASAEKGASNSTWPKIHPRLVELVRAHRSTMIFVNSRRLAERLAGALNELAGEELVLAHHGSLAKDTRHQIESRLKAGELRGLVATSSLELGIDMGAIDLVIQVEAPPSIAAGLQRIGRAGHSVGAVSKGILFPKFRGDLLPTAASTLRMKEGLVEAIAYPRNALDVLAQTIVAIVSMAPITVERLYDLVRGAAPYAELPLPSYLGVLDLLSGRYPSDELSDLRPRITWDRNPNLLEARQGARRVAVINGGTIPDRGLYGVFLANDDGRSVRVGELDEEMVFESRVGDVFLLGASSWRIEEITQDKVLVRPAPGEPGRMPFWHGDRPGRPPELGRAIGALARELLRLPTEKAQAKLEGEHGFEPRAGQALLRYLSEELERTGHVPSDQTLVLERFVDEVGDWRICLLSPFGARVHAPWATAVKARIGPTQEVDLYWNDDGIVFRLPNADHPPPLEDFLPSSDELEGLVTAALQGTSLFAARFRENAARALLLPRKMPGRRTPLWAQRRRSADLLAVASRFPDFPIVLETYRECLRDVFDLPGLISLLRQIEAGELRVVVADVKQPSPMASALLFSFVANFIYEGDAPVAERRAQALTLDQEQLRLLLGQAELRALLDPEVVAQHQGRLQRMQANLHHADGVHDLLLYLGDLNFAELSQRTAPEVALAPLLSPLLERQRALRVQIAGEERFIAVEDAARYRDALGVVLPAGLPGAFLSVNLDALERLLLRYARTHGPFTAGEAAGRFGLGVAPVEQVLLHLAGLGRLVHAPLRPGGEGLEYCETEVLRALRQQSLAKLRRQVEPVEPPVLARFLLEWQGIMRPRLGSEGVLSALEQLAGAPLLASALESEILPARVKRYSALQLDELMVAGELYWRGLESLGARDGRLAFYLVDHYAALAPPRGPVEGDRAPQVLEALLRRGALFYSDLLQETRLFGPDLLEALWSLVWSGHVSNDSLAPLRARLGQAKEKRGRGPDRRGFRSRRLGPPGSEGRWFLLPDPESGPSPTERQATIARQLLQRHGVLTKEGVHAEGHPGGFANLYPVLKAMEEAGKVHRGYFVAGLGAAQFSQPGAEVRLRAARGDEDPGNVITLAATDPANPYGAALPWPGRDGSRLQRAAGATVFLHGGALLAYLGRTERSLTTFFPENEPERSQAATALAQALAELVERGARRALLVTEIDGLEPRRSFLAPFLDRAGFSAQIRGLLRRRSLPTL
jgi:ATP-dependent Lhr-like helicase